MGSTKDITLAVRSRSREATQDYLHGLSTPAVDSHKYSDGPDGNSFKVVVVGNVGVGNLYNGLEKKVGSNTVTIESVIPEDVKRAQENIKSQLDEALKQNKLLLSKNTSLKIENELLLSENTSLKKENKRLQSENTSLKKNKDPDEIMILVGSAVIRRIDNWNKNEQIDVNTKISELTKQIAQLNAKISELEKKDKILEWLSEVKSVLGLYQSPSWILDA